MLRTTVYNVTNTSWDQLFPGNMTMIISSCRFSTNYKNKSQLYKNATDKSYPISYIIAQNIHWNKWNCIQLNCTSKKIQQNNLTWTYSESTLQVTTLYQLIQNATFGLFSDNFIHYPIVSDLCNSINYTDPHTCEHTHKKFSERLINKIVKNVKSKL